MKKIEKIDLKYLWKDPMVYDLVKKINELVDAHNDALPEEPRLLICPYCGSDQWCDYCSSTLMGGPMNYYTYTCKACGRRTKVRRIKRSKELGEGRPITLGPEDEIQ